jgi:dTDP-glucose 4,6-dehydratase/UDP-glucuronate decarboxylase
MKCLVSGGAGFIGSHLCDKLIDEGHDVLCVDNLLTGSIKNIKHLKGNPHFSFLKHDVIKPLPQTLKAQAIFHLASPASPNHESPLSYMKYPVETLLVNSVGTKNLLDVSFRNKSKFLFASTSEIYGNPVVHPQPETYWGNVNPVGPRSCYDEGKRFGESLTMVYLREFSVDVRITRIFNTYGPRMDPNDGRVVVNFIRQALEGKPLTVYGDGKQTRSFCYVDDLVRGLILAMFSANTTGKIINFGGPEDYPIIEIAMMVKKMTGTKSRITFSALPEDDPERRKPDITYAKKILKWSPKIPLSLGLKKTITYMKIL